MTTIARGRKILNTLRDYFEDNGLLTEEILEKLDSLKLSLESSKKTTQRNLLDFFKIIWWFIIYQWLKLKYTLNV